MEINRDAAMTSQLAMLGSIRKHAKGEGVDLTDGFLFRGSVHHDARKVGHIDDPASVFFAIDLAVKNHAVTVQYPTDEVSSKQRDVLKLRARLLIVFHGAYFKAVRIRKSTNHMAMSPNQWRYACVSRMRSAHG